jgi:hypothetical protein
MHIPVSSFSASARYLHLEISLEQHATKVEAWRAGYAKSRFSSP